MKITADDAVVLLLHGKVVAVPTETVYGLAAIATMPAAVAKIFAIKNRPADNPLICHFHSMEQVKKYVKEIPATTQKLMHKFSPGPVSFMLDLPEDSALKFATCGQPQVIVRIPGHAVFLSILKKINQPVAAPSANTSGKISPTTAEMVEQDLGGKTDGVVDGGSSPVGLESAILDARSETEIFILRPGAIGKDEIRELFPDIKVQDVNTSHIIPGSRYPHYAPNKPVLLIDNISAAALDGNAALILTQEDLNNLPMPLLDKFSSRNIQLLRLGSKGDLNELAKNFYHTLSTVDRLDVTKAYFLKTDFGDSSLGRAIENRLSRILRNA